MSWQTLDGARARALEALPQLCDIDRVTQTPDPLGGTVSTRVTIAAGVKCRQGVAHDHLIETEERVGQVPTEVVYLPWGTQLEPSDLIIIEAKAYPVIEVNTAPVGIYTVAECGEAK